MEKIHGYLLWTDKRIGRVRRRLGHKHTIRTCSGLDKVVRSNICHDLGAWVDIDV